MIKIIITNTIEKEFQSVSKYFSEDHLKKSAIKAFHGLGIGIPPEMRKIYLTSKNGAGRALFLLQKSENKAVLVLIRLKNDKVGKNMSYKNPKFGKALDKNLPIILKEISEKIQSH